jgi:hypothetical protein
MCFTVSEQLLYLEIQFPSRSKEEGENWRQRSRNPSVPVRFRDHAQDPRGVLGMSFSSFNYERRCVLSPRRFLPALARLSLCSHTLTSFVITA